MASLITHLTLSSSHHITDHTPHIVPSHHASLAHLGVAVGPQPVVPFYCAGPARSPAPFPSSPHRYIQPHVASSIAHRSLAHLGQAVGPRLRFTLLSRVRTIPVAWICRSVSGTPLAPGQARLRIGLHPSVVSVTETAYNRRPRTGRERQHIRNDPCRYDSADHDLSP